MRRVGREAIARVMESNDKLKCEVLMTRQDVEGLKEDREGMRNCNSNQRDTISYLRDQLDKRQGHGRCGYPG